ncbi:hypothetical protein TIFTF001_011853 [Ficus carica]|uniref:Uncharacterized protein n=1 Tax=Ficus carica TaxID=3494 RepID=A0AA88AEZ4_FICCA|nr:hypothetical protein TIFTF001_011853 [Ficus carica]
MPTAVRKLQREFAYLNLPENESCRDGFEGAAYGAFSDYPLNSQDWISPKTTAYCAYAPHHQHEVSNSKSQLRCGFRWETKVQELPSLFLRSFASISVVLSPIRHPLLSIILVSPFPVLV